MVQFLCLIYSLLLGALTVNAVFIEDAFISDWQLENIGRYECVMEDQGQQNLIILSDYESNTLMSFVNETSGTIIFRYPLDFKAIDAMLLEDRSAYVLKDLEGNAYLFDASNGFLLDDKISVETFVSSCIPHSSSVIISNNTLKFMDQDSQLEISQVPLRENFESLKFLYHDNLGSVKFLYSTDDYQYFFESFENGVPKNQWHRDEVVSDVCSFTFVDIPNEALLSKKSELLAEQEFTNVWDAYTYRVSQNWGRFKGFLKENNYSPGKIIMRLMKMDSHSLNYSSDVEFGLAKYLIVASKKGQLSAIDVRNGSKVWQRQTSLEDTIFMDNLSKKSQIISFDKNGSYEIYDISNVTEPVLARKDRVEISSINLISKLGENKYLLQSGNDIKKIFCLGGCVDEPITTVLATHDKKGVHGTIVKSDYQMQDTWEITMSESEEIVAFAKKGDEPISNIGVTLGNRTVLYKYLYPNLASYVVANKKTGNIYVHLVDTVTGELLFSQFHDEKVDIYSPVNMVFGDSWFIYSFFSNEPIPEQRLVVVELYESLHADERVTTASEHYDPFRAVNKPFTISNAYYFPEVIKRMVVSRTKYQITLSAIILELTNGQITYLSKALLNARRQPEVKMTDSDKKEVMAMPYISTLPLNDQFIITHSRALLMGETAELISVATNLESTSIVCDIGHDIFCTKLHPSGQFDTMSPSFEKGKLLATILGLFVLSYFLRPMVESAQLKTQWLVRS